MLPKTAEYALRAAVWLGRDPDQTQSADHLAERTQVPRRYLHKVLQDLVRAKIVRSQSGPGGGYALARCAAEDHHSGCCKCRSAAGANSPLSVGSDIAHSTLPVAQRIG